MQDLRQAAFHYAGSVQEFRKALYKFLEAHDWAWTASSGEPVHVYEPMYHRNIQMSIWIVRAPNDNKGQRVASFCIYDVPGRQTVVEIMDGTNLRRPKESVQPIGIPFAGLLEGFLEKLEHALARADFSRGVAILEDKPDERREIGETELRKIILSRDEMREYYSDYAPATAMKITQQMTVAYGSSLGYGKRWGPAAFEELTGLTATTVGRYLKALWLAGLREINGIPIPYSGPRRRDTQPE